MSASLGSLGSDDVLPVDVKLINSAFSNCGKHFTVLFSSLGLEEEGGEEGALGARVGVQKGKHPHHIMSLFLAFMPIKLMLHYQTRLRWRRCPIIHLIIGAKYGKL